MNCRRAQSDIALWAGGDLDESSLTELQCHLEVCPDCRAYREEMQALMRLMEEGPLRDEVDETSQQALGSLWPALSSRLVAMPVPRTDRFNGWVPAVAVAAVCLAMVLVASPPQLLSPHEATEISAGRKSGWTANPTYEATDLWAAGPSAEPVSRRAHLFPAARMPVGLREHRRSIDEEMREFERYFGEMERRTDRRIPTFEERTPFGLFRMEGIRIFVVPTDAEPLSASASPNPRTNR